MEDVKYRYEYDCFGMISAVIPIVVPDVKVEVKVKPSRKKEAK